MKRISDFFLLCSGAHMGFLSQCPTEKSKYAGLGAAIFFTGLFAFLAAGYALYTVFNNYYLAIILGLLWGFMIFNLDRYIVSSMRKEGGFFKEFLSALPRLIIAVIISIVIAKPLELRIFQKEIEPELIIMEQKSIARQEQEVRSRFSETQRMLKDEILMIEKQLLEKSLQRDALVRIAQEEADGTGGSRKKNLGPIFKLKKADAIRAEEELADLNRASGSRIAELSNRVSVGDSLMQVELGSLKFSKRDGLAARMEAMSNLKDQSPPILMASMFLMLLLIALETVPVFVKLISPKGPYDNLLKAEEFKFTVIETEQLAKSSATLRKEAGDLPHEESSFVHRRLDQSLKRG